MRIRLVCATALLASSGGASAQVPPQDVPIEDIESAYWKCIELDARYRADEQRMDESVLSTCAAISKRLQIVRFGDDFGKLHEWTKAGIARARSRNGPVETSRYAD